ncbi:hypothetical protein A2U01_0068601, partial [Trifolium medium]|nr:hypothetical protein [Trifolium medium]
TASSAVDCPSPLLPPRTAVESLAPICVPPSRLSLGEMKGYTVQDCRQSTDRRR